MNVDPTQIKLFSDFLPLSTKEKLFNPAANAIGKGIGGIFDFIFYLPMKYHIYSKAKLKAYAQKIALNLNKIPPQYRSTDKLDTTTKIMEESKYSVNNNILQSWFAKLLSSSVDSRKNKLVSNYFPFVLSNIDTEDATFLRRFSDDNQYPIGNLKFGNNKMGYTTFRRDVIDWDWHDSNVDIMQTQENEMDLLQSFSLIRVDFQHSLTNRNAMRAYECIRTFMGSKIKVGTNLKDIYIDKGIVRLTDIGKRFMSVASPK